MRKVLYSRKLPYAPANDYYTLNGEPLRLGRPMTYKYCEQFGFDAERRKRRLALLGLGEADVALAETLHRRVIDPHVGPIVEAFHVGLGIEDEYRRIVSRGVNLDRLKHLQGLYLLSLGVQFDQAAYFEERLRVGLVHARVGVPLGLYAGAFGMLHQRILDYVPPEIRAAPAEYRPLAAFLVKIAALDMSLASDTYHLAKVQGLETSLHSLRRAGKELRHKVQTDALTGAASHSQAVATLQHALRVAQRDAKPLCIAMVDLDHFKNVNDTHGHLVGDEVLRDATARMRASVRDFDTVGRYGGEEFLIILENATLDTANVIAERMRRHVEESPIQVKDMRIRLTLSLGLAAAHKEDGVESLLERADAALYAAKAAGRNCVRVAEHDGAAG
jgi:diguanylate cyclase (GGDEF)-like protein